VVNRWVLVCSVVMRCRWFVVGWMFVRSRLLSRQGEMVLPGLSEDLAWVLIGGLFVPSEPAALR
jgi:hypothetical protein